MDYKKAYKEALERARKLKENPKAIFFEERNVPISDYIFPELAESEDERIRKDIIWLDKQGPEPNWCHHKVDLSNCSEEYRKAYYDGWNNCNMQHSQCKSESNDVVKCLINGMTFYYEDNTEATWGTKKFSMKVKDILAWLEKQEEPVDKGEISDGYHTFNELYYYRMLYNAAFFNLLPKEWVHKSKRHHDGEECFGGGWFIVMANLPTGQISNHYELKDWELFQIPEKEVADEWDGHTPQEAAERLHKYLLEKQGQGQVKESSILQHESTHEDASCKENDNSLTREQKPQRFISAEAKEALYGEPTAWSEEDERFLNQVIGEVDYALNDKNMFYEGTSPLIDWLKSLKQRRIGGGE